MGPKLLYFYKLKVVLQLPLDDVAAYNELLLFTKSSRSSLSNFYCQTQKVMNTWNNYFLINYDQWQQRSQRRIGNKTTN